jgi:hypothetical protein
MNVENKIILITGANPGIARALVTTVRDQRIHRNPATLVTPWSFDTCISICTGPPCTRSYRERNEKPTSDEG